MTYKEEKPQNDITMPKAIIKQRPGFLEIILQKVPTGFDLEL